MIASVISLSVLDKSVFYCVGFSGSDLPVGGITVVGKSNNGGLNSPLSHILNVILPEPTNIYIKTKQNHQICNSASKNEKSHPPTAKIAARRWLDLYESGGAHEFIPIQVTNIWEFIFFRHQKQAKKLIRKLRTFLMQKRRFSPKKLLSCGNPQDKVLGIFFDQIRCHI